MSRIVDAITGHTWIAILAMVVLTAAVGAGAPMVDQSSSLDQFQSETTAAEKLEYIEENFDVGAQNTTTAQVIVRDDNVIDRESLIATLEYQERLRANATIGPTLVGERPTIGLANVVAITAIRQEQAADLRETAAELQTLNESVQAERAAIQARADTLNATALQLRGALTHLRQNPNASVDDAYAGVRANTTVALNETDAAIFDRAAGRLRNATSEEEVTAAYELGTRGVLVEEYAALQDRQAALRADATRLQTLADRLQRQRQALRGPSPTLDEQLTQLREMNASAVEDTVLTVLPDAGDADGTDDGGSGDAGGAVGAGGGTGGPGAFAFMPTSYEPGSSTAEATMLVVTQETAVDVAGGQAASEEIVDAQLAMQSIGRQTQGMEFLVFGSGIINHEINASMEDSLMVVAPLAILFVLVALTIAYRDVLDILLGLLGIGVVLLWTFGFMGWLDISFNQLFVAVPVLLIGLSIDYAIHIFMRHREERLGHDDLGPRASMRVALGGVGIALVLVTATTVIGFLSNLTSPVPPIREFGVVSSAGIVAALLVFGVLTPALKITLDEFLERHGISREKRAFGTGGGAFSRVLSTGATAARRAPWLVILLAVLVSAGGAYGATQVDTSFDQSDFLAEDPPAWMEELPEPFAPGTYTAKANLEYVNERFVRQDSQAQLLVQGAVTDDDALERVWASRQRVAGLSITQRLSNDRADITSPVSVMRDVAATNASFNATYTAADADGDGVPDRNIAGVYDHLFTVAPDRAGRVIARSDDGRYEAVRMIVSIDGGAASSAVTSQLQGEAGRLSGGGLAASATGQVILFDIVQDQLLETVIESLLISLVAVFAFLMIVYRFTEGSATLGAVTLLPVLLSVSWILGTMYLLEIPFNVLTGMITSLTVGLGVAYSIHLSERYSQELERTRAVWPALRRSVTGTGGALLGSAATTVGGFGVLVFAVLPPLQQFGIITGLTIVYAFVASVLVLPSLLVVWTKYLGPDWADVSATGVRAADEHAAEERAADERAAGGTAVEDVATGASGPNGGAAVAERTVETAHVVPGDRIGVTVTVDAGGRVVLREDLGGLDLALDGVDPEPTSTAVADGGLYVVWASLEGRGTVRYTATIPAERTVDAYPIDGAVMTPAGDSTVAGESSFTVVADLFERAVAEGGVSEADLRAASRSAETGDVDAVRLERIYRAWLRGETRREPDDTSRADAVDGDPSTGDTDAGNAGDTDTGNAGDADAGNAGAGDAGDATDRRGD